MARIIFSRLIQGLLTLFVLVTITFFLVRMMPGSPYTDERHCPNTSWISSRPTSASTNHYQSSI